MSNITHHIRNADSKNHSEIFEGKFPCPPNIPISPKPLNIQIALLPPKKLKFTLLPSAPPLHLSTPPLPGVFVIHNKPLGDVKLTKFQVTLKELESHSGAIFHPKLDRNKAGKMACSQTSCWAGFRSGTKTSSTLTFCSHHPPFSPKTLTMKNVLCFTQSMCKSMSSRYPLQVVDLCTSTACKLISLEKLAFIRYKQR